MQNFRQLAFVISAPTINKLPTNEAVEIAMLGRSNAGKSSLINALANHGSLARRSKTPGCTQLMNVFESKSGLRLVDMPGYGYAKRSMTARDQLAGIIRDYVQDRDGIDMVWVIMDIRLTLQAIDEQAIDWLQQNNRPIQVILNKADKLSRNAASQSMMKMKKSFEQRGWNIPIHKVSAVKQEGLDHLYQATEALMKDRP